MSTNKQKLFARRGICLGAYGLLLASIGMASGIPEPALILYGSVTNTAGSLLLSSGGVNWQVVGGASSASASSTIASVNGQCFYIAHFPLETPASAGVTFTPNLPAGVLDSKSPFSLAHL